MISKCGYNAILDPIEQILVAALTKRQMHLLKLPIPFTYLLIKSQHQFLLLPPKGCAINELAQDGTGQ